ncbi:hypothetical protein QTP86_011275 [Hemibagrus guttatus]|nr:hypothetical protein QTP86_011275 [Hemibagrus guttatus]
MKKVQEVKYLGSTVQSNGECGKEVKKRVQAGWNGWRKVSGVLCDQKISARIKGKVYKTVVRPAMLYGLETVSLRKRQESELEVAELKMLRFSLGVTRLDRIRNEYIRGTTHVGRLGDKVKEARLRWFGHVQRRKRENIGRRMLDMELPGRRQRGRPKRRHELSGSPPRAGQGASPRARQRARIHSAGELFRLRHGISLAARDRSPVATPVPYSGSAEDCNGFLLQCSLALEMQPHLYPDDRAKVAFIISHLDGKALRWAEPLWTQNNPIVSSLSSFIQLRR